MNTDIKGTLHGEHQEKKSHGGLIVAAVIVALAILFFFAYRASAHLVPGENNIPGDRVFRSTLTNSEEVPITATTASGDAHFVLLNTSAGTMLRYQVVVHDAENITSAHLHCGARGVNGPVVANLYTDELRLFTHGELAAGDIEAKHILGDGSHCTPKITSVIGLTQAMREGQVYVNVHTTKNPAGDIRGQVIAQAPGSGTFPMGDMKLTILPNSIHITGDGIDIREIGGAGAGQNRFTITVSDSFLRKLGDMYSLFSQAVNAVLSR